MQQNQNLAVTQDGHNFLKQNQKVNNLHIVTVVGMPKIGKSTLLSKLFAEPGKIQLKPMDTAEDSEHT